MATTPRLWTSAVVAAGALLALSACAPSASPTADIDPADGNWYRLGVDFSSAWGDVVEWEGGPDFTDADWEVECSETDAYAVFAIGSGMSGKQNPIITVQTAGSSGEVDSLQIEGPNGDPDEYLWYASFEGDYIDHDADPGTVVFDGNRVTVTGQAFLYSDYDYETPLSYKIHLTCDTMY